MSEKVIAPENARKTEGAGGVRSFRKRFNSGEVGGLKCRDLSE